MKKSGVYCFAERFATTQDALKDFHRGFLCYRAATTNKKEISLKFLRARLRRSKLRLVSFPRATMIDRNSRNEIVPRNERKAFFFFFSSINLIIWPRFKLPRIVILAETFFRTFLTNISDIFDKLFKESWLCPSGTHCGRLQKSRSIVFSRLYWFYGSKLHVNYIKIGILHRREKKMV